MNSKILFWFILGILIMWLVYLAGKSLNHIPTFGNFTDDSQILAVEEDLELEKELNEIEAEIDSLGSDAFIWEEL